MGRPARANLLSRASDSGRASVIIEFKTKGDRRRYARKGYRARLNWNRRQWYRNGYSPISRKTLFPMES